MLELQGWLVFSFSHDLGGQNSRKMLPDGAGNEASKIISKGSVHLKPCGNCSAIVLLFSFLFITIHLFLLHFIFIDVTVQVSIPASLHAQYPLLLIVLHRVHRDPSYHYSNHMCQKFYLLLL